MRRGGVQSRRELDRRAINRLEERVRTLRDRLLAEKRARKTLEDHVRELRADLLKLEEVVRGFHEA